MGSTCGNIRYKFCLAQFCVISTPTLVKSITPLLHKNQTKHELSRTTRVSQNVYFSFCIRSDLLAHDC